ncbi:MAG: hypothetical protein JNK72_13455 [Myxococcales bacterium]|nr:hypothetical protein [Myxococcales bacterium]
MSLLRVLRAPLLGALTALAGCGGEVPVEVDAGPFTFEVDGNRIALPTAWRNGGTVASPACAAASDCPALGPDAPAVRCDAGRCVAEPFRFELATPGVIDLTSYAPSLSALGNVLDSVTVTAIRYDARATAASFAAGPVELFWGPESASSLRSDGVQALGTVPDLRFQAGQSTRGAVAVDPRGSAALGQYILQNSRRFRVFARAAVRVAPGAPVPSGQASIAVTVSLRAVGDFVR